MTTCKFSLCIVALITFLASCAPAPTPATPTGPLAPTPNLTTTLVPPPPPARNQPTADAQTPYPSTALLPTQSAMPARIRYTVRSGDTLLGIALLHRVSMAAIQLANNLGDGDVVRAGQTLEIPARLQWDGESPYWIVHIVRRGETLVGIAQSFGVASRDVLRVNAIADPGLIVPGQPIVIPLDSLRVAAATSTAPPPTRTATPKSTPALTRPAPTPSSKAATPMASSTPLPAAIPADIAAWPATVVSLINQKRAAHGLPPYAISPELMRAAQAHADDCRASRWCGHTGSDGSDTKTREMRAGYNPTAWGENWVQALDPAKAVDWWYNETPPNDPHRKNLLHARYDEIGIGIAQAEYGYYFIADFGHR